MIPLKEDVVEAYRALLGREPESDDAIRSMQVAHSSVLAMVLSLQASVEYRDRQSALAAHEMDRPGAGYVDMALLERFRRPAKARAGHIHDWIGTRYARRLDPRLEKAPDVIEPGALSARDAVLWTALLSSTEAADNHFTFADVGAGWGRWTAVAARAATVRGIADRKVLAAEAQPDLCSMLRQHLSANGVTTPESVIHEGVIAPGGRKSWFPVLDVAEADHAAAAFAAKEKSRRIVHVERPGMTLVDFLVQADRPCDFCLLDCARSVDILIPFISRLDDRVLCLALGTGSREEEGAALRALSTVGWRLMADVPSVLGVDMGRPICHRRGIQIWKSPH